MMNENLVLAVVFVMGGILGAFFFGGLWWTVQKGITAKRPAFWFFGSLLLRTGITVAGFYALAADQWQRLAACLLGFIAVRFVIVRLTRSWPSKPGEPAEE